MEELFELICIIVGAILLFVVGIPHHVTWAVVVGIILLAIGGVWIIFIDDIFNIF